jgi:hypothetical protein
MDWVLAYFEKQVSIWKGRKNASNEGQNFGHVCYAARQVAMWETFKEQASFVFSNIK